MIFTLLGGFVAGSLFGLAAGTSAYALVSGLVAGALSFGAKTLLGNYLNRQKQRSYSAVQGESQLGGAVPVSTLFGPGATAGHRLAYFKFGSGNKYNAEVFRLAHGWCDGLEPYIYFYGEKHALFERAIVGGEARHYGVEGFGDGEANLFSIRFYDGRPGQAADAKLVADTAALGQTWKATSRLTGLTYVVIERTFDAGKFSKGRPNFQFALRGLREYDPRKDSTVAGGAGSQRLDDPATWVYTENPAVHRLNYLLGLRGPLSGRTLIGMGKSLGQIDLASHVAAMNVADTDRIVHGIAGPTVVKTYACGLWVNSDDDHTEILKEFDDALAGYAMNRRGLAGIVVGAPQVPVLDLTDDDIDAGRSRQLQHRKSAFGLYNQMSGQYTSIAKMWQPNSLAPIVVNADVAADGRARAVANDFLQVTDAHIAQYLLTIRYRQNRKGGTATVPVSRRVGFQVMEGEWITWQGKTWLIKTWSADQNLRVTLELAETGADIYENSTIQPGPIVIPAPAPVNPALLSTVQDFNVAVGTLTGADGYEVPTLRFTWTPPADPSITAVRIFYVRGADPTGATVYEARSDDPESGVLETSKDIAPGDVYTARATIRAVPDRLKTFTPWKTTLAATGGAFYPIDLDQLGNDVHALLEGMQGDIGDNADAIVAEAATRAAAISAQADALADEVSDRVAAVTAQAAALAQEITDRAADVAGERADRIAMGGRQALDLRSLRDTVSAAALQISDLYLKTATDQVTMRKEIVVSEGNARAYSDTQLALAVGPTSALAAQLAALGVSIAGVDSDLDAAITSLSEAIADGDAGEALARQALELQVRGSYTGTDLTLVTEGLLYQERQTRISEDAALSTAIELVSAGVGILFDWSVLWSYNTSADGWSGNGTPTISNGWLRPANHATDPYVLSPDDLDIDGDAYKQVKLRIRKTGTPAWQGQFWWQGDSDTTWDSSRRVTIAEPSYVDGIAVITIDFTWSGTIKRIREDLSSVQDASNYFEIDWNSIGRPSPGASQAQVGRVQEALSTALAAEASDRETLSTILVGQADPTGLTLPTIAGGLVYDEKTARVAGDSALSTLITGVQNTLDDQADDIDALATAQTTMQTAIDTLGDQVTLNASNIDDVEASLAGKADSAVTDALSAEIETMGGGAVASQVGQALRDIRLRLDKLALANFDLLVDGQRRGLEAAGATAAVRQYASARIDVTDGGVALLGQRMDSVELTLPGLASQTITSALDGRLTLTEDGLESTNTALTGLSNSLTITNGNVDAAQAAADAAYELAETKLDATAIGGYYTKAETDGVASSVASGATTALKAAMEGPGGSVKAAQDAADAAQDTADDAASAAAALAISKASTEVTDDLQSQINTGAGGSSALAQTLRAVKASIDRLALSQFDLFAGGAQQRIDLSNIVAAVNQSLTSRIDVTDSGVAVVVGRVDHLEAAIPGLASLDVTSALSGRIDLTETGLEQVGEDILSINNTLDGKADATLLNDYYTKTETDGVATTAATNATTALSTTLTPQIAAAASAADAAQGDADAAGTLAATKLDASAISNYYTKAETNGVASTAASGATATLKSQMEGAGGSVKAAQDAAQAASDLAGGKGKVIYQSDAPAAADRQTQNLWIDTTGNANTPKRWDGSSWAAVSDKVATDAAAAAAAAATLAGTKLDASAILNYYTKTQADDATTAAIAGLDAVLQASIDDVSASVTMRAAAQASPGDGWARFGIEVRADGGGDWSIAASFWDVKPGLARRIEIADQFLIVDPDDVDNMTSPILYQDGEAYLAVANIGTVTAGEIIL